MASAISFSELFPELFPIVASHLPLPYRPPTLLSLALTCHRLHEVVIPRLLYSDVRLVGENLAIQTLNTLIAKAERVDGVEIQKERNPSLNHIHHLCIDSSIKTPIRTPAYHSINALQKLVDVDGLCRLSSLTLHVNCDWDMSFGDNPIDIFPTLPSSFLTSLRTKCPHLKSVYFTGLSPEFGNKLIVPVLFSIKVCKNSPSYLCNLRSFLTQSLLREFDQHPRPNCDQPPHRK